MTPPTIADRGKALQDDGRNTLVAMARPVNRFPDYVRLLVQQLAVTLPSMGRRRIADTLCRGGLHLSPSTVRRFVASETPPPAQDESTTGKAVTDPDAATEPPAAAARTVTARYPHHVWNVDLTLVPIASACRARRSGESRFKAARTTTRLRSSLRRALPTPIVTSVITDEHLVSSEIRCAWHEETVDHFTQEVLITTGPQPDARGLVDL